MWTLDVNEWDTDLPDNSDKFQFKRVNSTIFTVIYFCYF